jgi:spore maturation protein SpmA
VLNAIWLGLVVASVLFGAISGRMAEVSAAVFDSAESAVMIVLGLVGGMIFFLGIVRVAFEGGLRDAIAKGLAPLLRRLFPEVPADHPAMGAMVMNMASNVMGLGNAATPFGLKAMAELARINPLRGSASNAMVLFLAINTSAITLMAPTGTMMVRAAAGSASPGAIWLPTLFATTCSTLAAVGAYFLLKDLAIFRPRRDAPLAAGLGAFEMPEDEAPLRDPDAAQRPLGMLRWSILIGCLLVVAYSLGQNLWQGLQSGSTAQTLRDLSRDWLIPLLVGGLLLIGFSGRVRVYDAMIAGGREGLAVTMRIVPYLVAIIVAVGMFRASGALDLLISVIDPVTSRFGVPAEVLPMALLRPLSGSGAFAVMSETLTAYGPDSFIGMLTSTLMGSTETTFYVLALYLGAAGVTDGRHAIAACLIGDVAGFAGAVVACHWFFG